MPIGISKKGGSACIKKALSSGKRHFTVSQLSELSGVSRQAFYQRAGSYDYACARESAVIKFARRTQHRMGRIGMKKLFFMFRTEQNQHFIGRDHFMDICRKHKLTYHLKHKKRYKSADVKGEVLAGIAKNMVPKGLVTVRPNSIWCSDITYLKAGGKHAYLSLVIDYHSRKIIGWHLSQTMETKHPLTALDHAIRQADTAKGIIHHSDRGSQYRSEKYQKRLKLYGMTASMTDGGKPYQNARVERINGILKHEFGLLKNFENIHILRSAVAEASYIYNNERIHTSLAFLTPNIVHQNDNHIQKSIIKSVNLI